MPDTTDLSYDQCRDELDGAGIGKIALSTPMGPRIVAVNYVVVGDSIIFGTSPYSLLGTYARNTNLAFEVGHVDAEAHLGWSVVAVGRADLVDDPKEVRRIERARSALPRHHTRRTTYFKMPWGQLTGRRMHVTEAVHDELETQH